MSASLNATLPIPRVAVFDVETSILHPAWYRFFLALLNRTGGGPGVAGIPGGAPGNVQFNNAGAFGGLTNAQLTVLVQLFSTTSKGAVPASGGGTVNFLRADGTWDAPASGASLIVDDENGNTIASVGTLSFEGVIVSGSSPHAITNMTTIIGAQAVGAGAGVGIVLTGGAASNTALSNGGPLILRGGVGGLGAISYGGPVYIFAGNAASAVGYPADLEIGGGSAVAGNINGGGLRAYGGVGYGAGKGGDFRMGGGLSGLTGDGGNLQLVLPTGGSGINGQVVVNNDPSLIAGTLSWVAGAQLNNQTIFVSTRALIVTAVIGRIDAANGSAATLVIVKAASGTAPGAGTPLTSTSVDLTGTPDTNQTLTLSATRTDYELAAGDSLCMVTTGVLAASAGCITVWATPQ